MIIKILKILNELRKRMDEHNKFNKQLENTKKN